jgi:RNA polymerase sigma-70 factor (ECF subfamily)
MMVLAPEFGPQTPDETLMLAYQQGEERAFELLYRRYSPRVFGFLKKRTYDPDRVEEIFQMVFLKLHQSRAQYNASFPFAPWLFTICRTVLTDALRAIQIRPGDQAISLEGADERIAPESVGHPAAAIEGLSAGDRALLDMRFTEGLNFEEIALRIGVAPATARQRLSRMIRGLRQRLKTGGLS